jgi:RNA polymerase sigma-70 factor (ECF subfamily)
VRERLLAGDPPYLANAAGRGSLAGLVAVIATRAGLDWLRARSRAEARHEDSPRDLVASSDPERDHLRARFRGDVKTAFEAAVKDLEPRDRTMLRFHLVEGMTIDDVARLYQIHRATAARQLEKARERVASGVRRSLARATGMRADELRELEELVTSQLDLSLSRVLASG